jgi:hypothetical protein
LLITHILNKYIEYTPSADLEVWSE